MYGNNTTLELYLESNFKEDDVKNIIEEVFGKDIKIRKVNNLNNDILITAKTISDEQINNLVSKINEKLNTELTKEDLIITNNAKINEMDLIKPYILPVVISSILVLIYFIIRYKQIGILKQIIPITLITIIFVQLLVLSVYAITRLPINEFTMPIAIALFVISLIILTEYFEKKLERAKLSQKK